MQIPDRGYYDYHPTVALSRSIVLGGTPSAVYREVGHDVAALAGLPLIDLDRWLEHQVGQSLWDFLQQEGVEKLRRMESELLVKALSTSPCGLIIAGEGLLAQASNRHLIKESAAFAYLSLPSTAAYWELRRQIGKHGPRLHPHVPYPLMEFEQLRPLLDALGEAERGADWVCAVENRLAQEVLAQLFEALPALGRVDKE
ncbi:MAG: shikimate kinase [Candidatus Latescibacterota bacterium]|jgi:shikimate kinase